MKKIFSLGIVASMVATMGVASFATTDTTKGTIKDLVPYLLEGDATAMSSAKELKIQSGKINNAELTNYVLVTGAVNNPNGTNKKKIVFGLSGNKNVVFGKQTGKPVNQEIVRAATSNAIKKTTYNVFSTNGGTTVTTASAKVSAGSGEYTGAAAINIEFTNSSTNDRYAGYQITLTDAAGNTRNITLVTKALGIDKDDISNTDADKNDDNLLEYAGGSYLSNNHPVSLAELKAMVGKGKYVFYGANGINVSTSVSQASVNEGATKFNATLGLDTSLDSRYNADGNGKVFKLSSPFLTQENRQVNIDCSHQKVINLLGTDFCDKVSNGVYRRFYIYPIDAKGYDTLANASGNDGVINTENVITATVSDSKIAFNMPKGVSEVLVSLKEIDTDKLPSVPGITVGDTDATNEIVAPVLDTTSSVVEAPVVATAPVLATAPAATNAGQQNTGVSDVTVLAIALATISMAAAGVVASKKF